jgi:hypothetical protein
MEEKFETDLEPTTAEPGEPIPEQTVLNYKRIDAFGG